ncbi:MAG: hypothetical protein A3F54_05875 [Candidatus Kerfeldbacteria bacterium RIFCSPHIGHO2_12_FULL_48_17]|uniref:S-adenosylmethionine-dependent methyltransferase domain-containing protein n=1 Tax=Candidatus Kerfeldbacteria bacterium RIFCSPHIGHO2_12_FULL_48_17 TaxID=1798542 RepID=A0A1G2B2S4_9BACT|nr:MAG: hypothetical protein A3F54_05875 [Candidatus Kerfeldbacteria bacterium RIFCSPHIGHO2_12_FULL_48_17]
MNDFQVLITPPQKDYELIDSGRGEKLERYGQFVVARPDPQALWPKFLPEAKWREAHAYFEREWRIRGKMPKNWSVGLGDLTFSIYLSSFKHTGIFPEQLENWRWMQRLLPARVKRGKGTQPVVLNLFGYTGGATLACVAAGAQVCHVDGSKVAVTWARKNAELSGLSARPVRWILDDSLVFLRREVRRGRKYDGIILDPPIFGHGPKGEVWKIEEHLYELLDMARQVLSDRPLFFLLNGYAAGYSAIAYENNLRGVLGDAKGGGVRGGGIFEHGELAIQESGAGGRLLPSGIFARWSDKVS